MAKKNTSEVGFESKIWEAACLLRGNMDASEYKHVVLGLIFLKYSSDRFEKRAAELKEELEEELKAGSQGPLQPDEARKYLEEDLEDPDYYKAKRIVFVPKEARWNVISDATSSDVGETIDAAMRAIERENKNLKGVLPKNFSRPELDKGRLKEVVNLFSNIKMYEHGEEKDLLGRVYEYCLNHFAEQEGKRGGEFFTPSCIVRTIVEILRPFEGRVYDPCCGSGGMFVQSLKFIESHEKAPASRESDSEAAKKISVYGQESNATTRKLALLNLAIHAIEPNLGEFAADSFINDLHKTLKADFIMANPPFNLSNWGADKLAKDVRWKYGAPPASNANFAWLQHMIWHLSPKGRLGIVLANGSLSSQTGGEGEIRKNIVEDDLVECIVALPTQLFYTTQIPVSLWFLARRKQQRGKTLFIDARKLGTMVSRKNRELTKDDIKKISDAYWNYAGGKLEDVKGFCAVVDTAEIAKQDYILTPGRYVGLEEQEEDGEPFEEKMTRLTSELSELFDKSHELEAKIKENLGAIGFQM